ncbi:MAG: cyanophycinase [Planctomycetia bacterium]|nr:cyanophycinase [Planctomycetia bacterium]
MSKSLRRIALGVCVLITGATASAHAEDAPRAVAGNLVICGGGDLPSEVYGAFFRLAGGKQARIVVIPTASESADEPPSEVAMEPWQSLGAAQVERLHTRDRNVADQEAFIAPLRAATAVWIGGGDQSRLAEAYLGTTVERELAALLARGGTIGGTSAGAAIMSRVMIAGGNPRPEMAAGFDLLPGAIVDQHFLARNRATRLWQALAWNPNCFGVGIDEGTALVVQGRMMTVIGDSFVTFCWNPSSTRPARTETLRAGQQLDLVACQRAALARVAPAFPSAQSVDPSLPGGSLLIIGGGPLPQETIPLFIERAGGPDAPLVVVPGALEGNPPDDSDFVAMLREAGANNVRVFHLAERAQCFDAAQLKLLDDARGVWFSGGRQWRLVDLYLDTPVVDRFHAVLARGGVIAGSSAGATIQGDYLVRGNPLGNLEMMYEGYERGFGFLRGAAIDQHFTERNRFADMTALKQAFPQLLGLGIDEGTALVVEGNGFEVIGAGGVAIYDQSSTENRTLRAGDRYEFLKQSPTQ